MTTPTVTETSPVGTRVELGHYHTTAGQLRLVTGQRVCGVVRVADIPACGRGRHYLIERGLTSRADLDALVADYLEQASRWGAPPAEMRWLDTEPAR
jgi:hypothetical protein